MGALLFQSALEDICTFLFCRSWHAPHSMRFCKLALETNQALHIGREYCTFLLDTHATLSKKIIKKKNNNNNNNNQSEGKNDVF